MMVALPPLLLRCCVTKCFWHLCVIVLLCCVCFFVLLSQIDSALLAIALDDCDTPDLQAEARAFLTGDSGRNRWFDKHQLVCIHAFTPPSGTTAVTAELFSMRTAEVRLHFCRICCLGCFELERGIRESTGHGMLGFYSLDAVTVGTLRGRTFVSDGGGRGVLLMWRPSARGDAARNIFLTDCA